MAELELDRYTAAIYCCKALELECTRLRDLRKIATDLEIDGLRQKVVQLLGDINTVTSLSTAGGHTVPQLKSTQGFKKGKCAIIGTPAVNDERVIVDTLRSLHLVAHRHTPGEPVPALNEYDWLS